MQPGLRLAPSTWQIGGGVGIWEETSFDDAVLSVAGDGVRVAATFTDADGRRIEVRVDDRDGSHRRRGCLLAPVSDRITSPTSLVLVWLPVFDLVHRGTHDPVVRIDGVDRAIGALPGSWLHRRHLIKYAASVVVIEVFPDDDGATEGPLGIVKENADAHVARLVFTPPLPPLETLPDNATASGRGQSQSTVIASPAYLVRGAGRRRRNRRT